MQAGFEKPVVVLAAMLIILTLLFGTLKPSFQMTKVPFPNSEQETSPNVFGNRKNGAPRCSTFAPEYTNQSKNGV